MYQILKAALLLTVVQMGILFSNAQVKTRVYYEDIPQHMLPFKNFVIQEYHVKNPEGFDSLLLHGKKSEDVRQYGNVFAVPVPVNIDVLSKSKVVETSDSIIYLLKIKAGSAKNLSLHFGAFKLSPNARLTLYTNREITDSIGRNQNNRENFWATRVYQGNTLGVVLKMPQREKGQNTLTITRLNFGFSSFGTEYYGNPGASAGCNINVTCPEATGWEAERNSIALIVIGGQTNGTGALVMNTCRTNRPYLLTARHVYLANTNLNSWVFQFQFWSATCTPNSAWHEDIQFNGAIFRAGFFDTDFALLELTTPPPAHLGITYSGWSRSSTPATSATGLHHPNGDLMKFSHAFYPVTAVPYFVNAETHWEVLMDQGILQFGSSGSPLYDQNHRIVGQLQGNLYNQCSANDNNCFCTTDPFGQYGRFDLSWEGGGTPQTRLKDWLDSANTGAITTNTTDLANMLRPSEFDIVGNSTLCSGSYTYYLSGAYPGANVVWSSSDQSIASVPIPGTGNSVDLTKTGVGLVTLTATITSECSRVYTVSKTLAMGTPTPTITAVKTNGYGEPTTYAFTATFIPEARYDWYAGGTLEQSGPDNSFDYYYPCRATIAVYCIVVNTCGSAQSNSISKTGECIRTNEVFTLSPNPASSTLTVSSAEATTAEGAADYKISSVKIFDQQGNLKKQRSFDRTKKASMNISDLPSGLYIVEVSDGDYKEQKQLLIQK